MPELPEVETIKKGLQQTIVGRAIKAVKVRLPKIIAIGPTTVSNKRGSTGTKAKQFQSILKGQKIKSIKRRAKLLIIDLSGPYTITIHLKMTGQLIFAKKSELPKKAKIFNKPDGKWLVMPHKYTHVIFNFRDGSKLYFNDLRQFGYIRLVYDEELAKIKELSEFGPEPLTKQFTIEYWKSQLSRYSKSTVKQFLVDPKNVAGIGNIYSDEIMYCARVKPTRKIKSLSEQERKKLYRCVPKILKEAVRYSGSSVGDYFQVSGAEGTYGKAHRVYGRRGEKCKKCGSIIMSIKLGGRTSSYCPECQK